LTLLLTLPRYGVAHVNSVAREQPGDAWFLTGTLTGFTLQEPQSHDVEPNALRVVVEEVLQAGRLVRHVPTTTLERARSALAASTVTAQGGILWARGGEVPGRERLTGLAGEAIHWTSGGGVEVERRLVYP
jgi:hypothetical protein